MYKKSTIIMFDGDKIKMFDKIGAFSPELKKYMNDNPNYKYTLYQKMITHSDLLSCGKCTEKRSKGKGKRLKQLDKNLLYYLTSEKMYDIELKNSKKEKNKYFPSAHQSNINLPDLFFEQLGVQLLQRRDGQQKTLHEHPLINDYASIYVVTSSLKYFDFKYTKKIFERLKKNNCKWRDSDCDFKDEIQFEKWANEFNLHYAIHGIGTSEDSFFIKVRRNLFVGDYILILLAENNGDKKLFFLFVKSPKFFEVLGIKNDSWIFNEENIRKLGRSGQGPWRDALASELQSIYNGDNIICLMTDLQVNYAELGTLFRASHIKRYSDCNEDEAYDINNGMLLSVSADALFDKYYISVDKDKKIVFSKCVSKNVRERLNLKIANASIWDELLNQNRMKYLEGHYKKFLEKEKLR